MLEAVLDEFEFELLLYNFFDTENISTSKIITKTVMIIRKLFFVEFWLGSEFCMVVFILY